MNERLMILLTGGLTEFTAYAEEIGLTPGQLLDKVLEEMQEESEEVPWPPPFELDLHRVGSTPDGRPILQLDLQNIDRDLQSFAVDVSDFDPEDDGTVTIMDIELGEQLQELRWNFDYRSDIGRIGGFQSRVQEYEDIPDVPETVTLCRITLDRDDEFILRRVSISGNHMRDGRERAFTYHAFADAEYFPEAA